MLEAQGVEIGYESRPVIHNASFKLHEGEVSGVIGPNGTGKTTLLKALSAVLRISVGKVVCGAGTERRDLHSMTRKEVARLVGVVPQLAEYGGAFKVFDVVLMGRYPHLDGFFSFETPEDVRICEASMELVGVGHLRERSMGELSGGERQLVALSRALAQETKILLLDEPTAHLDPKYQMRVLALLRELTRDRQLTSVVVLHDLNLAVRFCDRLLLLNRGSVHAIGTTSEVLTPENIADVFEVDAEVTESADGYPHVLVKGVTDQQV
ncbi:MAG: ABC transporter ATP-binding protein [Actinomycetota bacterium]|nr:ABC transporter ATP-binding protein [Actinomycetota bacterium]